MKKKELKQIIKRTQAEMAMLNMQKECSEIYSAHELFMQQENIERKNIYLKGMRDTIDIIIGLGDKI